MRFVPSYITDDDDEDVDPRGGELFVSSYIIDDDDDDDDDVDGTMWIGPEFALLLVLHNVAPDLPTMDPVEESAFVGIVECWLSERTSDRFTAW